MSNIPKAYQQGWVEFYKLKFKVTPDVLIPRPETELLVDEVLRFFSSLPTTNYKLPTVLDLGTGSGCIAISIAKNLSHLRCASFIATDISPRALKVAQQNAKLHGVEDKITFVKSNLLSVFCHSGGQKPVSAAPANAVESDRDAIEPIRSALQHDRFDVIVANLPYIPTERISYLDSSVKDFEPYIALDGGSDGFELYRKLFQQIQERDWKPKLIIGEIDYTHGELAATEAQKYFPEAQIETKTDLAHKQRILRLYFTKKQGSASEASPY